MPRPPAAESAGEFGRIDRYLKPLAAGFPGALGLTDDAAVFSIPADRELVITTDALVAGVHFLPDDPPADIAAKLLRVNLSDLAAMAADPLAYSLVTSLPADIGDDWLAAFAAGLAENQQRYGIHLMGGDSVSTPGPITLSVTAFGLVPKGQALRRRTTGTDDLIFVSGTIGDAALGLRVLQGKLNAADPDPLIERYRRPQPRLALVPMLRHFATAGLDVSDGLVADLGASLRGLRSSRHDPRRPRAPIPCGPRRNHVRPRLARHRADRRRRLRNRLYGETGRPRRPARVRSRRDRDRPPDAGRRRRHRHGAGQIRSTDASNRRGWTHF